MWVSTSYDRGGGSRAARKCVLFMMRKDLVTRNRGLGGLSSVLLHLFTCRLSSELLGEAGAPLRRNGLIKTGSRTRGGWVMAPVHLAPSLLRFSFLLHEAESLWRHYLPSSVHPNQHVASINFCSFFKNLPLNCIPNKNHVMGSLDGSVTEKAPGFIISSFSKDQRRRKRHYIVNMYVSVACQIDEGNINKLPPTVGKTHWLGGGQMSLSGQMQKHHRGINETTVGTTVGLCLKFLSVRCTTVEVHLLNFTFDISVAPKEEPRCLVLS